MATASERRNEANRGAAVRAGSAGRDAQLDFHPGPYSVSADSRRLVYLTSSAFDYVVAELYSQPLDGSSPPAKLNGPLTASQDVTDFVTSPDSLRVVFSTYDAITGNERVFSAPIDGGTPAVELAGPFTRSTSSLCISPDSRFVYYDHVSGTLRLWLVPIDGSASPQPLSGHSNHATEYPFAGPRVLYCASMDADPSLFVELYSAPIDGSAAPVRINGPLVSGRSVRREYALTPDGTRVVFCADQEVNNRPEVYVAPVDGGVQPLKLSGPVGAELPRIDSQGGAWIATNGVRSTARCASSRAQIACSLWKPGGTVVVLASKHQGGIRTVDRDTTPRRRHGCVVRRRQTHGARGSRRCLGRAPRMAVSFGRRGATRAPAARTRARDRRASR